MTTTIIKLLEMLVSSQRIPAVKQLLEEPSVVARQRILRQGNFQYNGKKIVSTVEQLRMPEYFDTVQVGARKWHRVPRPPSPGGFVEMMLTQEEIDKLTPEERGELAALSVEKAQQSLASAISGVDHARPCLIGALMGLQNAMKHPSIPADLLRKNEARIQEVLLILDDIIVELGKSPAVKERRGYGRNAFIPATPAYK